MTVVLVGNPRTGSRTRAAGELVAERLTGSPAEHVVELAELGPKLLGWGDPDVARVKELLAAADLVVVASPVFKATYTGLLKLFLDQVGAGELHGTTAVPVMLGGSPAHSLAGELTLKPVLVEVGLSCPTPALYLLEDAWESGPVLDAWLERAAATLRHLLPGGAADQTDPA